MRVLRTPGHNRGTDFEGEALTEDSMKPFLIVAHKVPVNDRQYATEADAIEDAMALAESSGYTYQVIKVCGTAVCHKKAEWKGVE